MRNMRREYIREMCGRIFRSFIDIFILFNLAKTSFLSGYDIIIKINKQYGFLPSPGTVYSVLYKLERDGLIKGQEMSGKRIYCITEKGRKSVEFISKNRSVILKSIEHIIASLT